MPIKDCTKNGKKGKKAGDSGKCYTGKNARADALKQLKAMKINQRKRP